MDFTLVAKRSSPTIEDETFLDLWTDDEFEGNTLFSDHRKPHEKPPKRAIENTSPTTHKKPPKSANTTSSAATVIFTATRHSKSSEPPKRTDKKISSVPQVTKPTFKKPIGRASNSQGASHHSTSRHRQVKSEVHVVSDQQFIRKRTNRNQHSSQPIKPATVVANNPAVKLTPIDERLNLRVRIRNPLTQQRDQTSQTDGDCRNCQYLIERLNKTKPSAGIKTSTSSHDSAIQVNFDCLNCHTLIQQTETLQKQLQECRDANKRLEAIIQTSKPATESCVKCTKRTNSRNIRNRNKQRQYRQFYAAHHSSETTSSITN